MDKLLTCAKAFENLLHTQYKIVIGRKGKTVTLIIRFSEWDFHHLVGLGKLKDLRIARKNRRQVFEEIVSGQTTYQTLTVSRYLPQIENRFEPLGEIEKLFDDNRLVFQYNAKLNQYSLIEADYLLSSPYNGSDIYIFVAEGPERGEKINLLTGESMVQYDRLTTKKRAGIAESVCFQLSPLARLSLFFLILVVRLQAQNPVHILLGVLVGNHILPHRLVAFVLVLFLSQQLRIFLRKCRHFGDRFSVQRVKGFLRRFMLLDLLPVFGKNSFLCRDFL